MPTPKPPSRAPRDEDSNASTLPSHPPPPNVSPINGQPPPSPMQMSTPPGGQPVQMVPGVPAHLQPYAMQQYPPGMQQYPPGTQQPPPGMQQQPPGMQQHPSGYPMAPQLPLYAQTPTPPYQPYPGAPPYGPAPVSPGALYPLQSQPQPLSTTGQMRLYEADELPSQYKLAKTHNALKLAIAGVIAVSVAASTTYFILRSMRDSAPLKGSIHVTSNPAGATVFVDGAKIDKPTPVTIDDFQVGTRHEVKLELARHKPYAESVVLPKNGDEYSITGLLEPLTGKLLINSHPSPADVYVNGEPRGRTPETLTDLDMSSAKTIEIRLKGYAPYVQKLEWPKDGKGEIDIDATLQH
jgi:hypothetical protein